MGLWLCDYWLLTDYSRATDRLPCDWRTHSRPRHWQLRTCLSLATYWPFGKTGKRGVFKRSFDRRLQVYVAIMFIKLVMFASFVFFSFFARSATAAYEIEPWYSTLYYFGDPTWGSGTNMTLIGDYTMRIQNQQLFQGGELCLLVRHRRQHLP